MKSVFGFRVRLQNPKSGFPNRTQPQSLLNELRIEALSRIYQIVIAPAARKTGNLSKDVFERRTSTGSEVFSLLICLDANKFVLLSFSSLIKTIYPRFSTEPLPNDAKSPLPVDVRRSKTLLLKLPIGSDRAFSQTGKKDDFGAVSELTKERS